jgi:hypothetical protein
MNAKTVAERVSEHRARRKAEGLVKLELWVHENDVTRIKKEAEALAAQRDRILREHGLVRLSMEDEAARLIAATKAKVREKLGSPIEIDGVRYASRAQARQALGLSHAAFVKKYGYAVS